MRKGKRSELVDSIVGQHLALSVAAHLARSQLVSNPLAVYDAQHLSEMLDVAAAAIAKVAPLYAKDQNGAPPRQLTPGELEGLIVKRGATIVVLRDGRSLSSVSIKRADLRQAIAILKAVGVPQLQPGKAVAQPRAKPAAPVPESLETLVEIEGLLCQSASPDQLSRANRKLLTLARQANKGRISNLAMQLMSALQAPQDGLVARKLAELRAALEETAGAQE